MFYSGGDGWIMRNRHCIYVRLIRLFVVLQLPGGSCVLNCFICTKKKGTCTEEVEEESSFSWRIFHCRAVCRPLWGQRVISNRKLTSEMWPWLYRKERGPMFMSALNVSRESFPHILGHFCYTWQYVPGSHVLLQISGERISSRNYNARSRHSLINFRKALFVMACRH